MNMTLLSLLLLYVIANFAIVLFLRYQGANMGWNSYYLRKSLDKSGKINDNDSIENKL